MKTSNKKKSNSKYTTDWIPVKTISNGMIVLDNNEKVTGVKIMPKNIFILDTDQQASILTSLKNFYNMLDFEFWVISADRPVDISLYLSQLQLLYNSTQNSARRKMINQDINKANTFMNNNIVDTEYFLLFKEKDIDVAQKKIRTIINGLSTCNLNSSQVSNDDLRIVLDNFLNGGMTTEFGTVMF